MERSGYNSLISNKQFGEIFELLIEGVQIIDFNWKYIYVNEALVKVSTYRRDELLGFTMMEKYPGIEHTAFFQVLKLCMEERIPQLTENRFVFPDGSASFFELSIQPVPEGIFILSIDITEKHKVKENFIKVNRLYAFLSAVNQSIVHIPDEQQLMDEAVRIAIEIGKFRMARIDMQSEDGRTFELRSLGAVPEIIEEAEKHRSIAINDPGFIHTPRGMAFSTGTYKLSNDFQNDPGAVAWKAELEKMDIHSVVSFPLKKMGKTIAVLSLYCGIRNFFDQEEVLLLQEAAGDISFAIDNFEKERKHRETEALVVRNEKRFRALIEKSKDMKSLFTTDGKLIYASPSIERVLGYTPEAFMAKSACELIHEDDLERFKQKLFEIQGSPGSYFMIELRGKSKDGNWLWLELTITNMLHEPSINAMVANFRDITERKLAEAQSEFDKNNLNALINNTKDLMWSVDTNFNLITSNQPFDEITLRSGKKIEKGDNVLESAFSKEQLDRFSEFYERAFRGETFSVIEYGTEPSEYWLDISFCPILRGGEVIGTACHAHNITERKRTEENLKQSAKSLKEAQAIAHMGNWEMDFQTNMFTWSEEACRIYGLSPEDNVHSYDVWLSFVHPDDLSYVNAANEEARKTWSDNVLNYRIVLKNGIVKHIYLKSKFEFDQDGRAVGLYGIAHDITEIKEAEEQFRKSEAFNRGVLDSLSSHIAVIDSRGNIVAVNEAWNRFAEENGETAHPEEHPNWSNYFHVCELSACACESDQTADRVLKGMRDVMDEKTSLFYFEYPCHSHKEERWFAMRIMKFYSDEPMVVVSHENITELKKTQKERDHTLQVLENRVEERTRELVDKNLSIMDSINYAKRIQMGLLTTESQLYSIFPRAFLLSRPRDIVSGDFFWCHHRRNKKFIVVADCTGHGVPGALMSIIGNNLLNQIIVNEHIENPSEVLELLDERLNQTVRAGSDEVKDGMDLALCMIDTHFNELYFAGAYRPVFITDAQGNINELLPDRIPIGGISEVPKKFETTRLPIIRGQRIYLSSDGYYSQFGGPKQKKFMKSRFVDTLEKIQHHDMPEQKVVLQAMLMQWMGNAEQVDDIMVVGIEL